MLKVEESRLKIEVFTSDICIGVSTKQNQSKFASEILSYICQKIYLVTFQQLTKFVDHREKRSRPQVRRVHKHDKRHRHNVQIQIESLIERRVSIRW